MERSRGNQIPCTGPDRRGAILSAGAGNSELGKILGLLAVITATINVVGGFMVTDRMLEMFKKDKNKNVKQGETE